MEEVYPMETVLLEPFDMPSQAYYKPRNRYRADSLLRWMSRENIQGHGRILGLTALDISTTKYDSKGEVKEPAYKYRDWGIFGLGERPGDAAVVSTFRLHHSDRYKYIGRVIRVCIHETGHMLGLKHCPNTGCVMEDAAETIRTIDRVNADLCEDCRRRIRWTF